MISVQAGHAGVDASCSGGRERANVVTTPTDVGGELDMIVSLACDDPAVLGPRLGERWTTVALDIEVAGRYYIVASPESAGSLESLRMARCDLSCFNIPTIC